MRCIESLQSGDLVEVWPHSFISAPWTIKSQNRRSKVDLSRSNLLSPRRIHATSPAACQVFSGTPYNLPHVTSGASIARRPLTCLCSMSRTASVSPKRQRHQLIVEYSERSLRHPEGTYPHELCPDAVLLLSTTLGRFIRPEYSSVNF